MVGVIMGSRSDLPYMKPCADTLEKLEIPFEIGVVSAHRTPDRMRNYAKNADGRGLRVIIACAGCSAHLPGMVASVTHLPVLGVSPKKSDKDAVGSMIAMPSGTPLVYMGGGSEPDKNAGAENAALMSARILALIDSEICKRLIDYRNKMSDSVPYSCFE